jgi:hypothetical protein
MKTHESPSGLSLADLYRPEALQVANPHVWPSQASFDWWRRKHRAALLDAGAVVEISGRVLMHGPRTLAVALAQGAEQAKSRTAA